LLIILYGGSATWRSVFSAATLQLTDRVDNEMSRRQNNLQYGTSTSRFLLIITVQEEPAFLRRMREGITAEENEKDEKRRRRGSEEPIDEDEAPQIVIEDVDKEHIDVSEAKAFVAEKEGVKLDKAKSEDRVTEENGERTSKGQVSTGSKVKEDSVSVGMKKTRKIGEGIKRLGQDDDEEVADLEKSRPHGSKVKRKRMKLSFEEG